MTLAEVKSTSVWLRARERNKGRGERAETVSEVGVGGCARSVCPFSNTAPKATHLYMALMQAPVNARLVDRSAV